MRSTRFPSVPSPSSVVLYARTLDLRFACKDDEASFKRMLCTEPSVTGTCAFFFYFALAVVQGAPIYRQEMGRADRPFAWEAQDPRSLYFGMQLSSALLSGFIMTVSLLRWWCRRLAEMDWELVWICGTTAVLLMNFVGCRWHVPSIFGTHPDDVWKGEVRGAEGTVMHSVVAITLCACIYLPVRCCALWIIPVSVVFASMLLVCAGGSPFPQESPVHLILLIALAMLSYQGARHREQHARAQWITTYAIQEAPVMRAVAEDLEDKRSELSRRIQALEEARCSVIIRMTVDLRVCDSGLAEEVFFGAKVEGRPFTDLLAHSSHAQFVRTLTLAFGSCSIHPVNALVHCGPGLVKRRLSVMDSGLPLPRYLVGISKLEGEEEPASAGFSNLSVVPVPRPSISGVSRRDRRLSSGGRREEDPPLPQHVLGCLGFSLSESSAGAVSFSYSHTSSCSSSSVPSLADVGVQASPLRRDQAVETTILWGPQGFRCMGCVRPPKLPTGGTGTLGPALWKRLRWRCSLAAARTPLLPEPGLFDGRWEISPDMEHSVNTWLQTFSIRGDCVVDGDGRQFLLKHEGSATLMLGGVLTLEGGVLHRDGKSGVRLSFTRVGEPMMDDACLEDDDNISLAGSHLQAPSSPPARSASSSSIRDAQSELSPPTTPRMAAGPFDGRWELLPDTQVSVNKWLQSFSICGDTVVAGDGRHISLEVEDGTVLMLGGAVWIEGGILHRMGRSGVRLSFARVGEPEMGEAVGAGEARETEPLTVGSPSWSADQAGGNQQSVSGPFDGRWELHPDNKHDVNDWLRFFCISGDDVFDGVGRRYQLQHEGGRTLLKNGVLTLDGDLLHRDGLSGVRLTFCRTGGKTMQDSEANDPNQGDCKLSSDKRQQGQQKGKRVLSHLGRMTAFSGSTGTGLSECGSLTSITNVDWEVTSTSVDEDE